MMFYIDK